MILNIIKELLTLGAKHGRTGQPMTSMGIVVHYVGNPGSSALANRNYFESGSGGNGVSAHYIVGLNGEIIQCIPENERAMHAGKSYGAKWEAMAKTNNSRFIGIEVCHPDSGGKFSDITQKSLVALVADICQRYKFNPLKDVYRHYDVCGKACPLFYVNNPADWAKLVQDVNVALNPPVPASTPAKSTVFELSESNLKAMQDVGVINSPNYWRGVTIVEYLDALLSNAAKDGVLDKRVDNGVKDINIALKILKDAGIANTSDYWRNVIEKGTVEYLDDLLMKIAEKSRIVLEKIVQAEAGSEDEKGMILVVNVIMNRVESPNFPDSIYDVIFQPNQFEPTRNGAYDRAAPSEKVKAAVDKALNGINHSQGALYFRTIKGATDDCWHERTLTKLFDHGCHRFYE